MKRDRVYIIAEAGVNHNGSLEMARALVDAAADAGADGVKFQTFKSNAVISRHAVKAAYQAQTTGSSESQLEMVKRLELNESAHRELQVHCRHRGIQFLSTPFDSESADFLVQHMDVPFVKIPSGEITNGPLLLHIANYGRPVVLSTGMSTLADIEMALGVLAFGFIKNDSRPSRLAFQSAFLSPEGQTAIANNVTLLHCTTEYPAPFDEVNLRAMQTLRAAFGIPVGYSDHTQGIAISLAAVALGAQVLEKHFTLDRSLPGPDHQASLEPGELASMVASVRNVEMAMGREGKIPGPSELKNKPIARKSLVAARHIKAGDRYTEENMAAKRPGTGVSPMAYWDFLGAQAPRDFAEDEPISLSVSTRGDDGQ